jgi:anti-sigma factor RsiW
MVFSPVGWFSWFGVTLCRTRGKAMATFSDETLVAFVDGELDPAQAVQVQLALIADEMLAKRVERFRYVRRALRSTYDAVVKEPVPDYLLSILNELDAVAPDNLEPGSDEPAPKPSHPRKWGAPGWAALAATLALGVLLGRGFKRRVEGD